MQRTTKAMHYLRLKADNNTVPMTLQIYATYSADLLLLIMNAIAIKWQVDISVGLG